MVTSSNAKSYFFGEGENSPPKGARKYSTLLIPSFLAIACERAYSKPDGFLIVVPVARPFQNAGAGRSKPTMSFPACLVGTDSGVAPAAAVIANRAMLAASRTRFMDPPSVGMPGRDESSAPERVELVVGHLDRANAVLRQQLEQANRCERREDKSEIAIEHADQGHQVEDFARAAEVRQVQCDDFDARQVLLQRLDSCAVRPVAPADEESLLVQPHDVAALRASRSLQGREDRNAG